MKMEYIPPRRSRFSRAFLVLSAGIALAYGLIQYQLWRDTPISGGFPFKHKRLISGGTNQLYFSLNIIDYDPVYWRPLEADAAAKGMRWSVWGPSVKTRALYLDVGRGAAEQAWFLFIPLP